MQAIARRAAWSLPNTSLRRNVRVVAGRRYPLRTRSFHQSAVACRRADDAPESADSPWQDNSSEALPQTSAVSDKEPGIAETDESSEGLAERLQRGRDRTGSYGSAARRAVRHKKPKELPPILIPDGFFARNVLTVEELQSSANKLDIYHDTTIERPDTHLSANSQATGEASGITPAKDLAEASLPSARYQLHASIWEEILATVRTGLSLPTSAHAETFPAIKSHVLLQCPKDGSIYFLDAVVEKAAAVVGADLVKLDAQDIAEIAGEYVAERPELTPYTIRSLGYEAQQVVARQDSREMEETVEEEDDVEEDDEEMPSSTPQSRRNPFSMPSVSKISAIPIGTFAGTLDDLVKSGKMMFGNSPPNDSRMGSFPRGTTRFQSSAPDHSEDTKLGGVVAALIETRTTKRQLSRVGLSDDASAVTTGADLAAAAPQRDPNPVSDRGPPRPLVLLIRDYKEIQATAHGGKILQILHDQVRALRRTGLPVILVGTVSSADLMPSLSKVGIRSIQSDPEDGLARAIIVTPPRTVNHDSVLAEDESRRMREINLRHLQDMIRRRTPDIARVASVLSQPELRLDSSQEFASGLQESVWSFDRVHRVAVTALGLMGPEEELSAEMIGRALQMLDASDEVKFDWASEERQQQKSLEEPLDDKQTVPLPLTPVKQSEEKMKRIRKKCNTHEKKLLSGVINPESINTTFADVRAPPETVEALKTLTSLSLVRPEAFSYGVLATDKIPGLLLYGPPGTGKTMLAKAVAKESGATMLEVSGSEVYDMYVGEGEKNVKATFTLAKKLSPCVVFIDEADAIFGSRGGHANRTSHRELINQFLREWDGMNDLSAFIMVATNRPFDLDDAVLRRLPRRLLVDLPVQPDREAILAIHLQHEVLDPSVSIPELARQTPFYSGSDLKNLAVASALACVREENEDAASHKAAGTPHEYPAKRTLSKRHFDRAMEEISASISEDMSSLAAIRKFDEKYGDRKGRRKKRAGYGFGTTKEADKETGRVRN